MAKSVTLDFMLSAFIRQSNIIYIYIYIYCHPQTFSLYYDFSVWLDMICFKLGSKPRCRYFSRIF